MRKILLIRLSSLGDIVLLTPVIEILSKKAEIHLITQEEYKELFENDSRVKEIHSLKNGFRDSIETLKEIRKINFDMSVDLHLKPLSLIFLLFSKAKRKRFYRKRLMERRLSVLLKRKIKEIPISYLYYRPFSIFIKSVKNLPLPRIYPPEGNKLPLPEKFVALAPGAKYETKRWPGFLELAKLLKKEIKIPIVLVGDSRDLDIAKEIEREVEVMNLVGKTTLRELIFVLSKSSFLVSNDSGTGHLAAALGKPVYILFGPTIPEFGFRPHGFLVRIFEVEIPCRPCSLHGEKKCMRGDLACLSEISHKEVYNAIREDLKNIFNLKFP